MKNHAHLKTSSVTQTFVIDSETNELLEHDIKRHTYLANSKEEFLLLYTSLLGVFEKMEQSEIRVFAYLLRYADGTLFQVGKPIRMEMAKHIELTERTIYNTIKILEQKSLLFRHESGVYQINPRYAFRGSSSDRNDQLKAIIELGCNDC